MLAAAAVLFREVSRAQADLDGYVHDARDAGASWQAVGEALGLTAAVARERFGPAVGSLTAGSVLQPAPVLQR